MASEDEPASASIWNWLQGLELSQRFYDINGVRTRSIEAGSGPPLIFLHGTGGHAEAYLKNLRAHAAHFRVHAIDMVGHGYTAMPDIGYQMQDYVDFMLGFVDAIGAQRVLISGESLGASVAAWFAIQHPERVSRLVMNTGMLLPPGPQGAQELRNLLERTRKATTSVTRETIRQRMRWLVLREESLSDEIIEARYQIYRQPGRASAIRYIVEQSLGALLEPALQARWYAPGLLEQIKCPTLVLWTRHNPGQTVLDAQQGAALIPDARLVVLENSAHWPQWEESEQFDRAHLDFLLPAAPS